MTTSVMDIAVPKDLVRVRQETVNKALATTTSVSPWVSCAAAMTALFRSLRALPVSMPLLGWTALLQALIKKKYVRTKYHTTHKRRNKTSAGDRM